MWGRLWLWGGTVLEPWAFVFEAAHPVDGTAVKGIDTACGPGGGGTKFGGRVGRRRGCTGACCYTCQAAPGHHPPGPGSVAGRGLGAPTPGRWAGHTP